MGNPYDQPTSHGEGIAHILKTATSQHWSETFEIEMMLALCIPVVCYPPPPPNACDSHSANAEAAG